MTQNKYDVFISYASEDIEFARIITDRLRQAAIRVWFDQREIRPGDHLLAKLNEGLSNSRKMVAIWSKHYFKDNKIWTRSEIFYQQHDDPLSNKRPLIPLLLEDTLIPPTLRNIITIDFKEKNDFDLKFRQLLESLDLNPYSFLHDDLDIYTQPDQDSIEHKQFIHDIETLYTFLGFHIEREPVIQGISYDLLVKQDIGGIKVNVIIICQTHKINSAQRDALIARQAMVRQTVPFYQWLVISIHGLDPDIRTSLINAGFTCVLYTDLLRTLVPLDIYNDNLLTLINQLMIEMWDNRDCFIRPFLETDIEYKGYPALSWFARWMGHHRSNFLVILGDLGTGKTTLSLFLAYHLAKNFKDDPIRHPAPVLIPLKDVRKEVSLSSIIIRHFEQQGIKDINFSRFIHLLKMGKIVLFFDAFDEMADRIQWDITVGNFNELRQAAIGQSKVILTCRTHYFKDRSERIRLIGESPKLTEIETELYQELRRESGSDVVFLKEFNDDQILDYLRKVRPNTWEKDWQKIHSIYNLKDLAHRPLMLDIIVKSLPRIREQGIDAANLYNIFTEMWIDREERKGRYLNKDLKRELMYELAWRMFYEETSRIHFDELHPFINDMKSCGILECYQDREYDIIFREMMTATFLKRNDQGYFSFMHRSFMEFFFAKRLYRAFLDNNISSVHAMLGKKRIDIKIISFLAMLGKNQHVIVKQLQRILTHDYLPMISENAIQIIYWIARIECGMADHVREMDELRAQTGLYIPKKIILRGAQLQDINLEGADLSWADFSNADLTGANLNYALLDDACFICANLTSARIDHIWARRTDFTNAQIDMNALSPADAGRLRDVKGILVKEKCSIHHIIPIIQTGHTSGIQSLALSPNNEMIAIGEQNGIISIRRMKDCRVIYCIQGHIAPVTALFFINQGKQLLSASNDHTIRLWDIINNRLMHVFKKHHTPIHSLVVAPDETWMISGGENGELFWWQLNGAEFQSIENHKKTVTAMAVSTTSNYLAIGNANHCIEIYHMNNFQPIFTLKDHEGIITCLAFSNQDLHLISGSSDKTARIWYINQDIKCQHILKHPAIVTSVCILNDTDMLLTGCKDNLIRVWHIKTGQLLSELDGHTQYISTILISNQLDFFISGSYDCTIRLWDIAKKKCFRILNGSPKTITCLSLSNDSKRIACGMSDNTLIYWDIQIGQPQCIYSGHQGRLNAVQFSHSGQWIASGSNDHTIRLWHTQKRIFQIILEGHTKPIISIAFLSDDLHLISGSFDQTIRIWDIQDEKCIQTIEWKNATMRTICFSSNGRLMAIGDKNNTIHIRSIPFDHQESEKDHSLQSSFGIMCFSPDSQYIAIACEDQSIRIWDINKQNWAQILQGHSLAISHMSYASDGKQLVSTSLDQTIRLWDMQTGACVSVFQISRGEMNTVQFSPNRRFIISGGVSSRLQLIDRETGKVFLNRFCFEPGAWLDLLPDGRFDASPEGMRYLAFTELGTWQSYHADNFVKELYDPEGVFEEISWWTSGKERRLSRY